MKALPFIALLVLGSSCSDSNLRKLASAQINDRIIDDVTEMFDIQEEIKFIRLEQAKIPNQHRNGDTIWKEDTPQYKKLEKQAKLLISKYRVLAGNTKLYNEQTASPVPEHFVGTSGYDLREVEEEIHLSDWDKFVIDYQNPAIHEVDIHNAKKYTIRFFNEFENNYYVRDHRNQQYVKAEISCTGPYKLKTSLFNSKFKGLETKQFNFYYSPRNGQRVILTMTKESGDCQLAFWDKTKKLRGLRIVNEQKVKNPVLNKFDGQFEYCVLPKVTDGNKIHSLFMDSKYRSMTCPTTINYLETLSDPTEGMRQKLKVLLGQPLPKAMMEAQDPYYPLDFSKAPELDAIDISYLVWRRDFYGTVLERLVRYHAERGTQVKIVVSKVISLEKDVQMLRKLESDFSNVKVRFYEYNVSMNEGLMDFVAEFHRTMHVKMLLTYSAAHPENNAVVIGGRNIHDGFVYDEAPDLSKYPELVQYGKDDTFAKWTDFEVLVRDPSFVANLAAQYQTVFEYDFQNLNFRNYTLSESTNIPLDKDYFTDREDDLLVRHFISFPYRDDHALEQLMIDVFDTAKKSITISTPYFNLSRNLTKALERAVDRGVKIQVITRLDLKGDTADIILSDVNKKTVNKFVNDITIYEFTRPSDILHSKLVLVDGELTTVGSVNFNKRSFYHDIENTMLVVNKDFNKEITKLLEKYKKETRLIDKKQKTTWWKGVIIGIGGDAF